MQKKLEKQESEGESEARVKSQAALLKAARVGHQREQATSLVDGKLGLCIWPDHVPGSLGESQTSSQDEGLTPRERQGQDDLQNSPCLLLNPMQLSPLANSDLESHSKEGSAKHSSNLAQLM